jgi:hypothetical protein
MQTSTTSNSSSNQMSTITNNNWHSSIITLIINKPNLNSSHRLDSQIQTSNNNNNCSTSNREFISVLLISLRGNNSNSSNSNNSNNSRHSKTLHKDRFLRKCIRSERYLCTKPRGMKGSTSQVC